MSRDNFIFIFLFFKNYLELIFFILKNFELN